jgi:ferric-dicitrate binding protein FerR (iron transport regulator)
MKPVRHTLSPHIVTIANNAVKNRKILLKDGSVAELFPGSELRYEDPFSRSSRHVYLSGKGFFKVAKEPARPFTVYSHDIATTALGTSFTITAYPGKNQVVVALHSGKVVVKHSTQDVYLLPGQQLACNIATGMATLQPIAASKKAMTEISSNAALGARTGFSASFDQTPMPAVLDTIAKGYQVQLQYDKAALAALLFSGTIREKDSLSQVLKRMALLYNLTVKTTDKQYIIQRNH